MTRIVAMLLVSTSLLLAGCATKPISVAKKYFAALSEKDYETAKKYITIGSYEDFELLFSWDDQSHSYKVLRVEEGEGGSTATAYYLMDDESEERYVSMVNADGVWLIDLASGKE